MDQIAKLHPCQIKFSCSYQIDLNSCYSTNDAGKETFVKGLFNMSVPIVKQLMNVRNALTFTRYSISSFVHDIGVGLHSLNDI